MEDLIGLACSLGVFVVLILLGLFAGGASERAHLAALARREDENRDAIITQLKSFPAVAPGSQPPQIVMAEVVIASDYLKTFLASLRNLFGGEVRSYQTLMDRARREATLRLVEEARRLGYNAICNLRLEPSDIGGQMQGNKKAAVMVAILASATAYQATPVPSARH